MNDPTREGGLFVFYGQEDYSDLTLPVSPANADITVRRLSSTEIPEGVVFNGDLLATAGDFNADGKVDLLVGEPTRILTAAGSDTILDPDERGTAYVLYSIAERGSGITLADADSIIRGEAEFDRFGTLPAMPSIDINDDMLDDLLIGATVPID